MNNINIRIVGKIKFRVNLLFTKVTLKEVEFDKTYDIDQIPTSRTVWDKNGTYVKLGCEADVEANRLRLSVEGGFKNPPFGKITLLDRTWTVLKGLQTTKTVVDDRGVFIQVIAKAGAPPAIRPKSQNTDS